MIVPGACFIPSAAAACDPYWNHVVLAMHFDGDFVDEKGHTITPAGTATTTSSGLFNDAGLFTGTSGDYYSGNSVDFALGTGDFTQEFWIYIGNQIADIRVWQPQSVTTEVSINHDRRLFSFFNGISITTGDQIPLNQWTHIAFVRSSGVLYAYLHGVEQFNRSFTYNFTTSDWRGNNGNPANNYKLDDLRITKGVARYTSDFTPPTKAFPDLAC